MEAIVSILETILKSAKFKINGVIPSIEFDFNAITKSKSIDERIVRLDQIRNDLIAASEAVDSLKEEAVSNKAEVETLKETINLLEEDKRTAEVMLNVPEESFSRLVYRANARGRARGMIEGILIGLVTGIGSSIIVWYFTKQ